MNENGKKRACFYFSPETIALCDKDLELAHVPSRNRFVEDAIKFYDCYLHKENLTKVLTPAFETVIDARLDLTEHRLSLTLFKLAVEMSTLMNVLAGAFQLDSSVVQRVKHRVIQEVKETNGRIDLEEIIKFQNDEI